MSGFEIAGLVLGAFPIAISALVCYRSHVAPQRILWRNVRRAYTACKLDLEYQQLLFTGTLKRLLMPLVVDDDRITILMNDPGGDAWRDPGVEGALKERLQDSYELYLGTIEGMQRVLAELNQQLARHVQESHEPETKVARNPSPPAKPRPGSFSKIRRRFRRAVTFPHRIRQAFARHLSTTKDSSKDYVSRTRFILGEPTRKRLFGELQKHNDMLEKILRVSDDVSDLQGARQSFGRRAAASAVALCEFWIHVGHLYRALSESWGCDCRANHRARLALQHRSAAEKEFQLVLSYDQADSRRDVRGHWQHCRLKVTGQAAEKTHGVDQARAALPPSSPQHRTAPSTKPAIRSKNRSGQKQGQGVPQITVTLALPTPTLGYHDRDGYSHILNLCAKLAAVKGQTTRCAGYLEGTEVRYYVYPEEVSPAAANPYATLAEVLARDKPAKLDLEQRYRIALDVASSFVQLKGTPWIVAALPKTAVELSRSAADEAAKPGPLYVAQGFEPPTPGEPSAGVDTKAIMALGVVLLELCFGRPIEEHPRRRKLREDCRAAGETADVAAAFDLMAAMEWQADVTTATCSDYADAVKWCLSGCTTLPPGAPWRREMLQNVVAPLERCNAHLRDGAR